MEQGDVEIRAIFKDEENDKFPTKLEVHFSPHTEGETERKLFFLDDITDM